jgi:hypothetical protein
MADPTTPSTADSGTTGFSTGEPTPTVEYNAFSRSVNEPTSTVAPKAETRNLALPSRAEPAKATARADSAAKRLLQLERREAEIAARAAQLAADEERYLSPAQKDQLVEQRYAAEGVQFVTSRADEFPLINGLGEASKIPQLAKQLYYQSGGKLFTHAQVARALEDHLQSLHEKANTVMQGRPRARPAAPSQSRQADWSDSRAVDGEERFRRALSVMDAVSRRNR